MFDCVVLAMGAGRPRDLSVQVRGYENIIFAVEYLSSQNKLWSGEPVDEAGLVTARDKFVVVIGGGDTGSDCVGTARRQGAKKMIQLEILPEPPKTRPQDTPWPMWPRVMRTSSSHEEACERMWNVMTTKLTGYKTRVGHLHGCTVEWLEKAGSWKLKEVPGNDFVLQADLVILAFGFLHVAHDGLVKDSGLKLDQNGNISVQNYQTSEPWVFAAGDMVSGAALVVRAIHSGRETDTAVDLWLKETD
jgi:glutamate synthase (NADPH/NADH) small chain